MRWEGRQGEPFISQNTGVNPTPGAGFINKFYQNIAMPTCLYVVYGCFCAQATTAESITCGKSQKYLPDL